MSVIPFLILISSGSLLVATFFHHRAEEALPVTCSAIVVVLYLFYCFNLLRIGYYMVLLLCILCYMVSIFQIFRLRKNKIILLGIMDRLFTLPMLIFAILSVLAFFYLRHNIVSLWDELRLWGAYPKALYYSEQLQLGNNSLLFDVMQSYFPGTALFGYFVSKSAMRFYEWHVYYAYAILYLSLIMPCLKSLKWKQVWVALPLSVIIYFLPLTFYNSYNDLGNFYKSLYIDPILGVFVAYIFYLVSTESFSSAFGTIQFAFGLFALVLLKDAGVVFASIALLAAIYIQLKSIKLTFLTTYKIGGCIVSILFPYFSWKILLAYYNVQMSVSLGMSSLHQCINFIKPFMDTLVNKAIVISNFSELKSLTFLFYISIIIIIIVLILMFSKKETRKRKIHAAIFLGASNVVFIVGLFFLTTTTFGGVFLSYERYISTILLADVAFIVYLLISMALSREIDLSRISVQTLLGVMVSLSIFIFPLRTPQVYDSPWNVEANHHTQIIIDSLGDIKHEKPIRICILFNEDGDTSSGLHQRIYYNLISENFLIQNFYTQTNIVLSEGSSPEAINQAIKDWCKYLFDNHIDYVYIARDNALFTSEYKSIFKEEKIMSECLYSVISEENGLILLNPIPKVTS